MLTARRWPGRRIRDLWDNPDLWITDYTRSAARSTASVSPDTSNAALAANHCAGSSRRPPLPAHPHTRTTAASSPMPACRGRGRLGQNAEGGIQLSEVATGARDDNEEFDVRVRVEASDPGSRSIRIACLGVRCAFAVSHHGEVAGLSGHPPRPRSSLSASPIPQPGNAAIRLLRAQRHPAPRARAALAWARAFSGLTRATPPDHQVLRDRHRRWAWSGCPARLG